MSLNSSGSEYLTGDFEVVEMLHLPTHHELKDIMESFKSENPWNQDLPPN
jgi:hypothetical protein